MSQEASTQPVVEAPPAQDQNAKTNSSTFDQVPIGGGSKFQFSEYPSDNDPPPVKKAPPVRKATKAKKEQTKVEVEDLPIKPVQPLDEIPVGGNNNQNMFDEKPIGKTGGAFMMSEFPQGQPEEAPATNYTMTQKLKSKAPKMRLSGMQDLLQLITNDPNNADLGEVVMSTLLKQTTPANMQKSLQCLKAWMQSGKNWGEDEAKNTIENGYINGKANAKKLAMQIVDLMYETKAQMIQMLILVGFKNKTPKIIAGYNAVLNELLAIYGIKRMKYLKPYLQEVIRVIGAQKLAAVKTEGMNTLRQAYKWMTKEVVEPMLGNLKEALKKQLDNEWQNYDKSIVMTAPKDIPEQAGKSKGKKIDAYELSQAVDIFKKYNQKWSESVIKAEKWSEKKDMMEQFVKAASVPKLANTQNRHIGQLVRRLINDANFNVVLWTLKIIGVMSKGLRKNFAPVAKAQFSNVIGKFRQKRTQMVEQTFATLNDLIYCLALQDVIEDVKEGFADKAPQMKINLIKWIGKHIEQKIQQKGGQCPQKTKDALKKLFPIIQKLLEDGVAEVRMQTTNNVAKLQLLLGQDFLAPLKGKLKKPLPKVEPQSGRQSKKPEKAEKAEKAENLTSSTVKIPKAGEPKSMPAKQLSSQLQKTKQQKVVLQCFDQPTFDQSLQTLIGYGLPEEQVKNINAATAADRGKILNYLRQNPYENFNAVVRVIRKAFKDWKQINVPMNKDLISYLQERASDIGKPQAYVLIPYLAEKYLEAKFSEQILKIIGVMCQRIPARFIIGHFLRYVKSPQNKKPKLNGQLCAIIAKIIQLVSIANCNLKQIAEYAKQTFNVNTTKKQAQELILCLYLHAGDSIKPFLDQNILKIMDGEFKNNKPLSQDQKRPKVEFQGEAASLSKPIKKQSAKQDGKPRDLTVQVQKALPLMNDNSNWQKRKDGAQLLTSQLQFGGKVHFGNFTGDLISCLKVHINDTNKQLIKVFVHLAGLVLISLPQKDLKTCLKSFITALTEGLSDKNEQNRRQITQTLGRIGQSLGKQHLLNNFGPYLEGDKEGRLQVLNLILTHQDGISKSDIRDYPKGLANCLTDKNKDIRAAAQKVFQKVYQKLGLEVFRAIAKDLRPAVAKDLGTFLDKFGGSTNTNTISSIASKGVSPGKANKEEPKPRATLTRPPPAPGSAQKQRSVSRGPQAKSFIQHDDEPHAVTSPGPFIAQPKSKVQGNQPFANKTVLQNERIQRQSNQVTYIWRLDKLQLSNEQLICNDIQNLINEKWAKKLLSMDYTKVNEVLIHFVKLSSKDINYQDHFRQLYDVFFKYILMKLWGGQPAFCSAVVQLVFPILSILQKKKAILSDFEVDLVIAIVRQYFISASLMGNKISENVYNIIKCLVALSSGERVLSKILKEFSLDLPGLHRHLRKETNAFYREGLSRAIKNHLANHVGSGDTMQEASKIKQLKEDPQFVNILFQRYREDTLHTFGFRRIEQNTQSMNVLPQTLPPQQPSTNHLNGSGVSYKPPVPPTSSSQVQSSINNGSFISVGDTRQKSGQRLPKRNDSKTATGDLRPSQLPSNKPYDKKNNPSLPQIQPVVPPTPAQFSHSQFFQSAWSNPYDPRQMSLSEYPAPHPASPLSKHLNKLLPPNDNIITFFNTLFQQSGQKIANQLTSNAKIIFGQILKSVQDLIDARKDHTPDKIVNQISLLQSCIKCPHIIKNIGELLGYGTSFALTQLVYEDEHKSEIYEELKSRNIEYKADNFIKSINGVMLRILQNAHPHQTVNVLLQLLTYHSKAIPSSPKTISLVVKCLGRVSKEFSKDLRPESIRTFLIRAHQYLAAIDYDIPLQQLDLAQKERNKQKIRTQDTASNIIKNIIIELCTAIRSQIWEHYEKSMYEATSGDRWIGAFISSLNIKPIQKNRGKSQQSRDNDELKKINDLLSKTKSFETGIVQLKKYTQKHQQFNVQEYFTSLNYDRKFIKMVIDSLDGQRRAPLRNETNQEQGPNENIQERIRRLRQRFQDLQPEGEGTQQNPMNRQKPQVEEDPKQQRALQIKRRIEQMKNKMNSAVRKR